jgi:large subunit ribosomal protein L21
VFDLLIPALSILLQSFFKSTIMYAIVDIAGKQFKVEANKYLYAPLMDGQAGAQVSFDKVLLIDDGSSVSVGTPVLKGASISGKIMEHVKGDKEIVFKKKRRKGYAKKNGHRQQYTRVMIESISAK